MKRQHLIQGTSDPRRRWPVMLRVAAEAGRDWATSDGLMWLHLCWPLEATAPDLLADFDTSAATSIPASTAFLCSA